uniref:Uncharacterized protein n=1 Tax=Knipowitschia caucasica TaxID=637954 RepID=A0AAV2LEJ1_KNICA
MPTKRDPVMVSRRRADGNARDHSALAKTHEGVRSNNTQFPPVTSRVNQPAPTPPTINDSRPHCNNPTAQNNLAAVQQPPGKANYRNVSVSRIGPRLLVSPFRTERAE